MDYKDGARTSDKLVMPGSNKPADPTDLVKIDKMFALSLPDTREKLTQGHKLLQDILISQKTNTTMDHTDLILIAEVFNSLTHGINYLDHINSIVDGLKDRTPLTNAVLLANSKAGNLKDG